MTTLTTPSLDSAACTPHPILSSVLHAQSSYPSPQGPASFFVAYLLHLLWWSILSFFSFWSIPPDLLRLSPLLPSLFSEALTLLLLSFSKGLHAPLPPFLSLPLSLNPMKTHLKYKHHRHPDITHPLSLNRPHRRNRRPPDLQPPPPRPADPSSRTTHLHREVHACASPRGRRTRVQPRGLRRGLVCDRRGQPLTRGRRGGERKKKKRKKKGTERVSTITKDSPTLRHQLPHVLHELTSPTVRLIGPGLGLAEDGHHLAVVRDLVSVLDLFVGGGSGGGREEGDVFLRVGVVLGRSFGVAGNTS